MENEENRGHIDKKAFMDQWTSLVNVTFCQLIFGALSLFSLSLILLDTQSYLGAFWHWSKKGKEGKRKQDQVGKGMIKQLQQTSLQVSTCMCIFLARFRIHGIACGSFLSWHEFFQV